jgi:hypothetical protein
MSTIHPDALTAKVAARNKVNAEAIRLSHAARAAFEPLLGQKVASVHGGLVKKYEHLKPAGNVPDGDGWPSGTFSIYQSNGYKSVGFGVRVHEVTQGRDASHQHAHYAEAHFTVGEIDERGFLMRLYQPFSARTDYTAEEVKEARRQISELDEQLRKLKGEICEFGQYDN